MFEVVPSKWMREYLKDRREFTDWEKATLTWNSPTHTWRERLDSLKELSMVAEDRILKCQIAERVNYEETAYQLFIDDQCNKFIYVVFDEEKCACGYFSEYELARSFGIKYCADAGSHRYTIEKQLLFCKTTKIEDGKGWVSDNNILKGGVFTTGSGYDGVPNACADYNEKGDIISLHSLEMTAEDNEKVDILDKKRFEYRFFKIPFGMAEGDIVKIAGDGLYAVLDHGEDGWNDYMERTDSNPSYYDFSDIQIVVFVLQEDGYWSHVHVNPMYLEPGMPEVEEGNKKQETYRAALAALSDYFKNGTKEANEKAMKASRDYADVCSGPVNRSRIVYESDDVEELLF